MLQSISRITLLWFITLSLTGQSIYYESGFESANEPYGNFKAATKSNLIFSGDGRVIENKGRHGSQCVTPGSGSGRYGKPLIKKFVPALKNDTIWLDFWMRTDDLPSSKYKGYLQLTGSSPKDSAVHMVANLIFYSGKVSYGKTTSSPLKLTNTWHNIKLHLNFHKQVYTLYFDEKKLKTQPFCSNNIDTITSLTLGGGASPEKLTYFDDVCISTDDSQADKVVLPPTQQALPPVPYLAINKVTQAPKIDGILNDSCWKNSFCLTPFLSINGKLEKQQQTQAFLGYDQDNLYIAFKCYDIHLDPVLNQLDKLKASSTRRDSNVFKDDSVELFLAPFNQRPGKYYHIVINGEGTIYDAALPKPGLAWNCKLLSGISKNNKSWNIEIKVPFKDLGINNLEPSQKWRVNFCRNKPALKEVTCWSPTFDSFHSPHKFGIMEFADSVPVINTISFPQQLKEGENRINALLYSNKNNGIWFQNSVIYDKAEVITKPSTYKSNANISQKITPSFTVYTGTDSRASSRSCSLKYAVFNQSSKKLIYQSPQLSYPIEKYSPFRTNLISEASGVFFVYTNEIFFANRTSLHRLLLLQRANDIENRFNKCTVIIDTPNGISLLNPCLKAKKQAQPLSFKKETIQADGIARNRYTLTIPKSLTYPMKKMGYQNRYTKKINLVFYCDSKATLPQKDFIYLHSEATINGKNISETPLRIPVQILPRKPGKKPANYPIISSFGNYNLMLANLSSQEMDHCLDNIANSGFNFFSISDVWSYHLNQDKINLIKQKGLKTERAFFPGHKPWIRRLLADQAEFLQQYPQYMAVDSRGQKKKNIISIAHLLNDKGEYRPFLTKHLTRAATEFDSILWDYENNPISKKSLCYSKKSIEDFKRFSSITENISRQDITTKYGSQWIEFQCWRNARLAKIMRNIIKKANPNCLFSVYSGYQSKYTKRHYGVDWKIMAPAIDYAICGYGRPLTAIKNTIKAITPKKLISGELIMTWEGNRIYDFSKIRTTLFRRLTDGSSGLLLFYDLQVDGRFWNTISDISRLISDYESYFLNQQKDNSLVKIISGLTDDDIVILKNKNQERLIFLFNESHTEKHVTIKNLQLPANAKLKDYFSGLEIENPTDYSTTLKSMSVTVLVLNSAKLSYLK